MTTVQLQKERTNLGATLDQTADCIRFPAFSPSCNFCDVGPVFCGHVSLVSCNLRQFLGPLGNHLAPPVFFGAPGLGNVWGRSVALATHPRRESPSREEQPQLGPPPWPGPPPWSPAHGWQLLASGTASAWSPRPLLVHRAGSGRQVNSPVVAAFHPAGHRWLRKGFSRPEPHQE